MTLSWPVHINAAVVLFSGVVPPVIQVHFEIGPGSCLAKDLARVESEAGGWLPELKADVRALDLKKAAEDTSTSVSFEQRMRSQNSYKEICEKLRYEVHASGGLWA